MNGNVNKIIGLTVGLIVLAVVLVPVINDAIESNQDKYTNMSSNYSVSFLGADDDLTITQTSGASPVLNGAVYAGSDLTVFASGNMVIEYFSSSHASRVYYWDGENVVTRNGVTEMDLSATTESISGTFTASGTTYTLTDVDLGGWAAYSDTGGKYVMHSTTSAVSFYVNSLDQVYGAADTSISSSKFLSISKGEAYVNGAEVDSTSTLTKVDGYTDLYTLTAYSADSLTPITWIVPAEVFGTEPSNEGVNNLLATIPLFVIIALMISAVALIRNKD